MQYIKRIFKQLDLNLLIFLTIYFIVQLFFLIKFPFVHSDEAWLSGLSRQVMQSGMKTTEPFFIEYPRTVHGLRLIFVGLQSLFIKGFGYSIYSVRLLSLTSSVICLGLIYHLLLKLKFDRTTSLLVIFIIGSHIQFVYVSHYARQEILILTLMIVCLYINVDQSPSLASACLLGIGMGIHPNIFLVALGLGGLYLYRVITKEIRLVVLVKLIVYTSLIALVYVIYSLYLNPNFISEYLSFGQSLGVINNDINRFQGFYYFYYKLFNQIGGTYQLMPIKIDIILLLVSVTFGWLFHKDKKAMLFYTMLLGINLGYFIIGRYNQLSIIFSLVISGLFIVSILRIKKIKLVYIAILLLTVMNSYPLIMNENDDYMAYESYYNLEGKVLANLNMAYHLDKDQLIDFRNLWHVKDFESYIRKHEITFIVIPDEIHYIKKTSPRWDILYGPLDYYDNMVAYLDKCQLVDTYESPTYAMRIARYINTYPWQTSIYKVPSK